MEQGQDPRPLCRAEGQGVHPPGDLVAGHAGAETAGRTLQEPHRAADSVSRDGQGAGATGAPAKGPPGLIRGGQRGQPRGSGHSGRDSTGL